MREFVNLCFTVAMCGFSWLFAGEWVLLWGGKRAGAVDGTSIEGAGSVGCGRERCDSLGAGRVGCSEGAACECCGVAASDAKAEPREALGCCGVESWRRRVGGWLAYKPKASEKSRKIKTAPEGAAILSRKRSKLRPLQKRSLSFPEAQKSKINIA